MATRQLERIMKLKDIAMVAMIASLLLASGCIWQEKKVVDTDGDGWSDEQEVIAGTDPDNRDTDGDGYWDPLDPNPLDPEIPVLQVTPTPFETVVPTPGHTPTTAPTRTPATAPTAIISTLNYPFKITDPVNGDRVSRSINVKGQGGVPGATIRIHVCTKDEGDRLRSGIGHVDQNGNWEVNDIGLWDVKGYVLGEEAVIYAVMTASQAGATIIRPSENVTVYRN